MLKTLNEHVEVCPSNLLIKSLACVNKVIYFSLFSILHNQNVADVLVISCDVFGPSPVLLVTDDIIVVELSSIFIFCLSELDCFHFEDFECVLGIV